MTRSRCCGPAERAGLAGRAFTLLELLVVLAIAGLLAGAVVPGVARLIGDGGPEATLEKVRESLVLARAEALRSSRQTSVEIRAGAGAIEVHREGPRQGRGGERVRRLEAEWLAEAPFGAAAIGEAVGTPEPRASRRVVFDSLGRASAGELRFVAAGDGAGGGGTIWKIRFDPMTGTVGRAEQEGDGR